MNKELAKDSSEFISLIFSWRGSPKEKAEYEISWTQNMANKYPHLASEYKKHQKEARIRLETILNENKGKDAEKEKNAPE